MATSVANVAVVNPNGTETLLTNNLSKFPLKSK